MPASVLAALMLIWPLPTSASPAARASSFDAPGLTEGPFITNAGLVWEGPDGVMLTNAAGSSSVLLAPDAPNWDNLTDLSWFGQEWWVIARPSGVLAGRIGGPLRELPLLRSCNPGSTSLTPDVDGAQYAVAGGHLYAVLPSGCLPHRAAPFGELVDVDLRSRRWHVLAPMPGTLAHMAASGKYLALAYWRPTGERRLFVRVLHAATGALANQITPPAGAGGVDASSISGIQVDDRGDVLVTAGCCGASPGQLAHVAQPAEIMAWWWARAGSTVGQEVHLGSDAALSDGSVAFLSGEVSGLERRTIDVTNLLAGTTRTVVVFSGSVSAHGLALSGNELAWAQQSAVLEVTSGPGTEACKPVALSPVELTSVDLLELPSSPLLVSGVPIPPQYANEPVCIEA